MTASLSCWDWEQESLRTQAWVWAIWGNAGWRRGGTSMAGSGIEALQRLFSLQNVMILKGNAAQLKDWLSVLTEGIHQSQASLMRQHSLTFNKVTSLTTKVLPSGEQNRHSPCPQSLKRANSGVVGSKQTWHRHRDKQGWRISLDLLVKNSLRR